MQWQAYRGVTAIGGIAASGSQWVLFHTEWLVDLRRAGAAPTHGQINDSLAEDADDRPSQEAPAVSVVFQIFQPPGFHRVPCEPIDLQRAREAAHGTQALALLWQPSNCVAKEFPLHSNHRFETVRVLAPAW